MANTKKSDLKVAVLHSAFIIFWSSTTMLSLTILSLLLLSTSPLVSTLPKTAPIQVLTLFYPLHLLTDLCQPWICGPDNGALYTLGMGLVGVKTSVESVRDPWVMVEGMYLCHSLPFPLFDHFFLCNWALFLAFLSRKHLFSWLKHMCWGFGRLMGPCWRQVFMSFSFISSFLTTFCLCNWALFLAFLSRKYLFSWPKHNCWGFERLLGSSWRCVYCVISLSHISDT